jgi:hypothetical protein
MCVCMCTESVCKRMLYQSSPHAGPLDRYPPKSRQVTGNCMREPAVMSLNTKAHERTRTKRTIARKHTHTHTHTHTHAQTRGRTYIHVIHIYIYIYIYIYAHTTELFSLYSGREQAVSQATISPPREGAGNPVHGFPSRFAATLWSDSLPHALLDFGGNSDHGNDGEQEGDGTACRQLRGNMNGQSDPRAACAVALTSNIVMYVGEVVRPLARKEKPNTCV